MVSIHTPYAGSDSIRQEPGKGGSYVSIHAPYAGSDLSFICKNYLYKPFQSTPPMQGATAYLIPFSSILVSFNPRPLCRERPLLSLDLYAPFEFQSTPPMQGATTNIVINRVKIDSFNPRPLCRERLEGIAIPPLTDCFNPRPLCRERLFRRREVRGIYKCFNPRPLCRERHISILHIYIR